MSLAYSMISLAFQIPFSRDHAPAEMVAEGANALGRATFVVGWPNSHATCDVVFWRDGALMLVTGVLDGQLGRHGGAGLGVRECGDGHRTAVDGDVADLLGDYER